MGIINFGKSEKKISIGFSQKKKKKRTENLWHYVTELAPNVGHKTWLD